MIEPKPEERIKIGECWYEAIAVSAVNNNCADCALFHVRCDDIVCSCLSRKDGEDIILKRKEYEKGRS